MKRLLIWGTGSRAESALKKFPYHFYDIVAFIDSNPERHGEFHGKPVLSPEQALLLEHDEVIIASVFHAEISQQAIALGFDRTTILTSNFLDFLPHVDKLSETNFHALCKVPWWYHTFEILPGVMTPGICAYKPHLLAHPILADLTGQRALDIGAWDGPYTLEMARRGASVTAFDIQPPAHSGFDTMRLLNSLNVQHVCDSVYNLSPEAHGTFDLITFFGVYYHLKNPLAAFAAINSVLPTGGLMLVEGAILEGAHLVDPFWKEHAERVKLTRDLPVATFIKGQYEGEWSNWWVPNLTCLRHWIESSGFDILVSSLVEGGTRGYCIARKSIDNSPEHIVLQPVCR